MIETPASKLCLYLLSQPCYNGYMSDKRARPLFWPDDTMVRAGQAILQEQLVILASHQGVVAESAQAKGVHEMRKAIRRMRTAFRLLRRYFHKGAFKPYRSCLKKSMVYLGESRDLFILLSKLQQTLDVNLQTPGEREAILQVKRYWRRQKEIADLQVQQHIGSDAFQECIDALTCFVAGAAEQEDKNSGEALPRVRYQAPILLYERLAAVRSYGPRIEGAELATLHELRIQFKELRYTMEFFAPILGPGTDEMIAHLNQIQDHLGDLNDARVGLERLTGIPDRDSGAVYRAILQEETERLRATFSPLWATFDTVAWREQLALALSVL